MRLIEGGIAPWLQNVRCQSCKSLFNLEARDLIPVGSMRTVRQAIERRMFEWVCDVCASRNSLDVIFENGEYQETRYNEN